MAASTSNAYPPSTFVVSDHVYPAAKERLPDRFALTKLGEIFSSWAETPEAKRLTSTETNGKQTIYFVHEQLKYESKVWTHLESYKGVIERRLSVQTRPRVKRTACGSQATEIRLAVYFTCHHERVEVELFPQELPSPVVGGLKVTYEPGHPVQELDDIWS
ncbi:hypothetical protein QOT17_002909 [Balamuthia mandrillaris]